MRRRILLCAFIHLLISPLIYAQKHDYQWLQGKYYVSPDNSNFIINFNTIPPEVKIPNYQYNFSATMLPMSDENGNLLFYTNGCTIKNSNKQNLENLGTNQYLLPDNYFCKEADIHSLSNVQSLFALPLYAKDSFIVFSCSDNVTVNPAPCQVPFFSYHIVDMKYNQGQGRLVEKNHSLKEGCYQTACANKHANGRDWWILLADNQQNLFYRWLLTPQGLEGPWTQQINNPTVDDNWFCGWSTFSPDGNHYAINACRTGVLLYNFDRCTGLLAENALIERVSDNWNWGVEFSPDGRFLYTVSENNTMLLQYDLNANDIENSKETVSVYTGPVNTLNIPVFGLLQHAPDGKLYIWAGDTRYMHVIHFPNRKGLDCAVQQLAVTLPTAVHGANLYYPHYRLGPMDDTVCDTLGIDNLPQALFRYDIEDTLNIKQTTFTDLTSYAPTFWKWTFGDGNSSQEQNPVHTYAATGNYSVCLIAGNAHASDTFCRQINVGTIGVEQLPAIPKVKVSPNPFSSTLRIELPAQVGSTPHFVLYDLFGREMYATDLQDFITDIPLAQVPAGVYAWRMYLRGAAVQSGKVVKME
jgi:WD40 repeat protein